ncbi:PucR family transcriptional regulator [Streptomyces sp. NPDC086766]|uniref:PucR family transcriptional regulator n=1 Tax=Streptomyces sp. NPDC086766 TaxID=3365754 RepID=UPI0038259352
MPAEVDAVVAEVAGVIDTGLPGLTTEMTDYFVEVIPEFRHDEAVRRLMIASTSANLVAIVDMLAHSIPLDRITVPPAAAEYARRFAQHDLSLEALLRAYRLGEHRFVQWALDALGRLGHTDTTAVLATVSELSERTNFYIDQVVEGLIDIYETERRRWDSRTGAARAAQLRLVLDNDQITEAAAQELLDVPMGDWHQAATAWVPSTTTDAGRILQNATRFLQETTGRAPLTMLADDRTLWAWITSPSEPAIDRDLLGGLLAKSEGLRIALGAPGRGLAGFRGSLREAQRARAVAETAHDQQHRLLEFDDVAVAALLTEHSEDISRWVARVLAGLTSNDAPTQQLRETLRVFLELNGSYTQAASRLHLHKNTVHYRIRKAEEIRGKPLSAGRLEVEVALRVFDLLHSRIG